MVGISVAFLTFSVSVAFTLAPGRFKKRSMPTTIVVARYILSNDLFLAASDGNLTELDRLLNMGANVNVREVEGETPLMYAAANGQNAAVNLLLDRGADLEALSYNHENTLARAIGMKQYDTVILLLDRGARIDTGQPLIYAAGNDDVKMVKLLLARGANVNSTDDDRDTALIAAASRSASAETVRVLLSAGADPNHKNRYGESAYDLAVRNQNQTLIDLFKGHRPKDAPKTNS